MSDNIDNFKQMYAARSSQPAQPYPPFPPIPNEIKVKFKDLAPFWDAYEKAIADWVKAVQTR